MHLDTLWHTTDYSHEAKLWFEGEQVKFMTSHNSWIVDGDYMTSISIRANYADTVILVHTPRYKRMYRIIKRSIKYKLDKASRPDMPSQFEEKFDGEYWDFLKFA